MRVQGKKQHPLITIVCCLHGDERFGKRVFDYFQKRIALYPVVKLIFANEEAYKKNKRCIDQDLNRSFPGASAGNHETKLAKKILTEVQGSRYVLDIHTTSSSIRMTPIITHLSKPVRDLLVVSPSKEVVLMKKPFSLHPLIGQRPYGVSFEFNELFAKRKQAMNLIVRMVNQLIKSKKPKAASRWLYSVTGSIPKNKHLPKHVKNFSYCPEWKAYPFLLHERSYPDIHALAATKKQRITI
ncbi:MAG TPA: succinylglutamate desuccinylase/aspartoacylase family protein [Patescibacteria group bacterium]|nr:succinylglutamate desuccinylase/aspartoacylase family protein [Patescibacteria group bacterium]